MTDPMLHIDSDNAMGSSSGNVDDGFAIAALIRSGLEVVGLSSIGGNAPETEAARNNETLARTLGWTGPRFRGASRAGERDTEASRALVAYDRPVRIVALGPLTNIAGALDIGARISQTIIVGSNPSHGRWPPLWPHESNLTWDRKATVDLFESEVSLTIVPLDVVERLRAGENELLDLEGDVGRYIRLHSKRWFRKKTRWWQRTFRIPDLVAAMVIIEPSLFRVERLEATAHRNGWIEYGRGRPVDVIRDFDGDAAWIYFEQLLLPHG